MQTDRKSRMAGIVISILVILLGLGWKGFTRVHTVTLYAEEGSRSEEISPVFGRVRVSGTADTSLVFTDTETGETFEIGYITPGVTETIVLERGSWYKVEGAGDLTLSPVTVRTE